MDAVAPGGTLLIVTHDPDAMRAPAHNPPFDPDAYLRAVDFAEVVAESPGGTSK